MSRIAMVLLCAAIAVTPTIGLADADAALEKLVVEMAETPQQHASLARYYQAKAAEARSEASRHDRMGQSYYSGKLTQRNKMRKHCKKISERYSEIKLKSIIKIHLCA